MNFSLYNNTLVWLKKTAVLDFHFPRAHNSYIWQCSRTHQKVPSLNSVDIDNAHKKHNTEKTLTLSFLHHTAFDIPLVNINQILLAVTQFICAATTFATREQLCINIGFPHRPSKQRNSESSGNLSH